MKSRTDRAHDAEVYLDNASTSAPKPDCVWESARDFLGHIGVSPGRSGHRRARLADDMVVEARERLASLFNADRPSRIAFTANATTALNTCIKGFLRPGDRVVTTVVEHNSVLRPLATLKRAGVVEFVTATCDADGRFDLDWFAEAITPQVRLVVVNHASNVTGAVTPVQQIVKLAHERGAAVLLDASQTAGVIDVDIDGWELDMMAFTGHKSLLGPSGIGGMYIRDATVVDSLTEGGTGNSSWSMNHPGAMPAKYEAGTVNYLGIAGLNAALRYRMDHGRRSPAHTERILERAIREMRTIPGLVLYTPADDLHKIPILSFNLEGLYASELASVLDNHFGILTRAGVHCAPLLHRVLGTTPHGAVRVSLGHATTEADVNALIDALRLISADIGKYMI